MASESTSNESGEFIGTAAVPLKLHAMIICAREKLNVLFSVYTVVVVELWGDGATAVASFFAAPMSLILGVVSLFTVA